MLSSLTLVGIGQGQGQGAGGSQRKKIKTETSDALSQRGAWSGYARVIQTNHAEKYEKYILHTVPLKVQELPETKKGLEQRKRDTQNEGEEADGGLAADPSPRIYTAIFLLLLRGDDDFVTTGPHGCFGLGS